jgi:hypothetical protein
MHFLTPAQRHMSNVENSALTLRTPARGILSVKVILQQFTARKKARRSALFLP